MRKSILFSVLAIAATIAIAAGASTFAAFTDVSTATTQQLTAGNVHMTINTAHGTVPVSATIAGTCVDVTKMADGDSCTFALAVKNTGNLSVVVDYSGTPTQSVAGCYTYTSLATLPTGDGTVGDNDLNPGDTINTSVTVTLDTTSAHAATPNDCQDATFNWPIVVTATQSTLGSNGAHD